MTDISSSTPSPPAPGEALAEALLMGPAALGYARAGWRVLPIWWLEAVEGRWACACGNPFCPAPGKHPLIRGGRGLEGASSDVALVEAWWAKWPRANVALATGAASGVVVVDLDLGDDVDGEVELGAWAAGQGLEVPATLSARTGGGGRHLLYQAPRDGGPPIRNAAGWLPGVDLRGEGGYVLAPPSLHASGRRYEWLAAGYDSLAGSAVEELGPLLGFLRSARGSGSGGGRGGAEGVPEYDYKVACAEGPPKGARDHFFNARAFELRKQDVPFADAKAELLRVWERTAQPVGDELPWEVVSEKLDRVWQTVEPEPLLDWDPLRVARDAGEAPSPEGKDTDLGNAQRFAELHGGVLRWTVEAGWLRWDGRYWAPDPMPLPVLEAAAVVESLYQEAARSADLVERERRLRWAKSSEAAGKLEAMAKLARGLPPIAASVLDFDRDPWLLNVGNGVLDLRTGGLRDHDPALMLSQISEVDYVPGFRDAEGRWEGFIDSVTGGDEELAAYLQRAAGYTLTASTAEEVMFLLYGPGASGKSTFLDALQTVLGGLSMLTQPELISARRGERAPADELARLLGKRLVVTVELPEGGRLAESLVKQLVGGDRVAARHLYKAGFEFQPTFKLWVATNHAPRAYDDAIWRRLRRVPFPRAVPEAERDPRLKAELKSPRSELSRAVLSWAVEGCLRWQAEGLGTCGVVEADTNSWRVEQDRFGRFLIEECVLAPWVARRELGADWWAAMVGADGGDGTGWALGGVDLEALGAAEREGRLGDVERLLRASWLVGPGVGLERVDEASAERARELHARYQAWCEREGERAMTATAFGLKLKERGFERARTGRGGGHGARWEGLRLRPLGAWGAV